MTAMIHILQKPAAISWLALLLIVFLTASVKAEDQRDWLPALLEKEEITIVLTDSGLGGLSVVADAAKKFNHDPQYSRANLVFVNALFSDTAGYNALPTREEKLAVFSSALQAMQERYQPDIILVACNTLSVLAPDTEFAQSSDTPVVGIIEDGVEQIASQLRADPSARNILFATQGTVDDATHASQLAQLGFGDERLVMQACPQLSLYIEQGFDSMYTEMLIDAYVDEALSKAGDIDGPLSVSFNCTHFGYSLELWQRAFASRSVEVAAYLDPNTQMVDFLLPESRQPRFDETTVTVKVVSMVDIPEDRHASIGRYLQSVAPVTATALGSFELDPGLFEWRSLTTAKLD
jgi:glutamate racemase